MHPTELRTWQRQNWSRQTPPDAPWSQSPGLSPTQRLPLKHLIPVKRKTPEIQLFCHKGVCGRKRSIFVFLPNRTSRRYKGKWAVGGQHMRHSHLHGKHICEHPQILCVGSNSSVVHPTFQCTNFEQKEILFQQHKGKHAHGQLYLGKKSLS